MSKHLTVAALLTAATLCAQTPAAGPTFDVASVKPSPEITPAMVTSGRLHAGMRIDGAKVDIGYFPLMSLICKAYDVKMYQVQGPPWLLTGQKFDIVANIPAGATKEQVPQMLQALLADRFKLVVRKETKDVPVYALVVAKGGLKMKPSEAEPAAPESEEAKPAVTGSSSITVKQTASGAEISDGQRSQKMTMSPDGKSMRLESARITMDELAEGLSPMADHPIVNETGVKGSYQVLLEIPMSVLMDVARRLGAAVPSPAPGANAGKPGDDASDPSGSIFTLVQSLGLKLEARKAPMTSIVVEHVEKMPTEN